MEIFWLIFASFFFRNTESGEYEHIKLNLIWSPLSAPFDWTKNVNYYDYANFLTESKIGLENDSLRSSIHKFGFDQWGTLFGTINEEKEFYYRGLRERILPSVAALPMKKLTLIGISDHGFLFVLSQHFVEGFSEAWVFDPLEYTY